VTLEEFERMVFGIAQISPICGIPVIRVLLPVSISIRVPITSGGFVDAFLNERIGTTAFAFILEDKRIFGADNTGGWHLHPFENSEQYEELLREISFADFITAIEDRFRKRDST
jgi:hypothetical protein